MSAGRDAASARPLVSVILPAYNAEHFIGQTIESVLAQTYQRIEVIVVDDGSQDRTPEIVRSYARKDRRVRLLCQTRLGVAAARNSAIEQSTGEFIAPIDADDLWRSAKLERQVSALVATPPAVGLVYVWSQRVDKSGRALGSCSGQTCDGIVYLPLLIGNFIGNSSSPLIRRECFATVGGYEMRFWQHSAQGCEDWELYLRIAEAYRFLAIPECLVKYRQSDDSMSADIDRMERSHGILLDLVRARHANIPEFVYRWSNSSYLLYIANTCTRCGKAARGLAYLRKAARRDAALVVNRRFQRLVIKNLVRLVGATAWLSTARSAHSGARGADGAPRGPEDATGQLWANIANRRYARLLQLHGKLKLPVTNSGLQASGRDLG